MDHNVVQKPDTTVLTFQSVHRLMRLCARAHTRRWLFPVVQAKGSFKYVRCVFQPLYKARSHTLAALQHPSFPKSSLLKLFVPLSRPHACVKRLRKRRIQPVRKRGIALTEARFRSATEHKHHVSNPKRVYSMQPHGHILDPHILFRLRHVELHPFERSFHSSPNCKIRPSLLRFATENVQPPSVWNAATVSGTWDERGTVLSTAFEGSGPRVGGDIVSLDPVLGEINAVAPCATSDDDELVLDKAERRVVDSAGHVGHVGAPLFGAEVEPGQWWR